MLLLFDLDGTLLGQASREHRDALHRALHEVHGIDAERLGRNIAPAGRTDGEISRLLLLEAGIPARQIDERRSLVREVCCQIYVQLCPQSLADRVLPGVPELLAWLETMPYVRLSLVTGNFEPVARLKLKRAGLGHYFAHGQGAYGSDSEDRTVLPHIARKRAGTAGVAYPRDKTYVIGDTPRDIACAHADGVHCLAVASGPFRTEELDGADAVAADAMSLRGILEELVGG